MHGLRDGAAQAPRISRHSARVLGEFGFQVVSMRGSQAKLIRVKPSGEKETLVVPTHRQLPAGTIFAIYRQASRYIPSEQLRSAFFRE